MRSNEASAAGDRSGSRELEKKPALSPVRWTHLLGFALVLYHTQSRAKFCKCTRGAPVHEKRTSYTREMPIDHLRKYSKVGSICCEEKIDIQ